MCEYLGRTGYLTVTPILHCLQWGNINWKASSIGGQGSSVS